MNRDDIQKLLGGYATGTLTPEEQRALFEAALTDQELFDALAREEALRDALSDGAARAHLLAALDRAPTPWYRVWWRPMVVMAAALTVVIGVAVWERSRESRPVQVAKAELPRFQPPVTAPSNVAPPSLPPPPEVRTVRPSTKVLPLPEPPAAAPARQQFVRDAAAPMPAPPPPAPSGAAIGGQVRQQFQPAQQSQQTQQLQQVQAQAIPVFPSQAPVPVRGIVTDTSGAAVASANIVVKSLPNGAVVNTATNERGEFSAAEVPGNTYEISASKAGFQTATVKDTATLDGAPAPVNLKLNAGAAAETVEVAASNASVAEARPSAARAGFGGAVAGAMKAKVAAPPAAIAYQLLRSVPGSDPVPVPQGGSVPAGSSLTLRITPAADGYLRIVEGKHTIANPQVTHGVVSDTLLPSFDKRGRVELKVYFTGEQPAEFTIVFRVQ